jgi:hypothetical protein
LLFSLKKKREKSSIDRSFAFAFASHYQPWQSVEDEYGDVTFLAAEQKRKADGNEDHQLWR